MMLDFNLKIFITYNNQKVFGNGILTLLKYIDEYGSLNLAVKKMGMSYSKAFNIIKNTEKELGITLTKKQIGGNGGGGSILTSDAYMLINSYEKFYNDVLNYSKDKFKEYFK